MNSAPVLEIDGLSKRYGDDTVFEGVSLRVDAGMLIGLTNDGPTVGATAGFTWVFNAFQLP